MGDTDTSSRQQSPKRQCSSDGVIIKEELTSSPPASPTQTVFQGYNRGGDGGDSPDGQRGNIRLRCLQTLMVPVNGGETEESSSLALVPTSVSHAPTPTQGLCRWREWRHQCRGRSIRDKLLFALEHQSFYKDVTLIVGKDAIERISAHKLILRLGSAVFENIMEGLIGSSNVRSADPETITDVLEIPEVEPQPFRRILHFMYTDHFSTEGLKFSEITAILHASRRFQIQDLVVLCVQALKTHINDDTAISLCEMGKDIDDLELRDKAMEYMCRNPKKIFYSSNFMDLSYKNLVLLIEHDDLEWDEISIFKSVLRWADEFCRRRGLQPVANNLRGALGEIIYRIRFPLMTPEQFTFEIIPLKVLTSEEQVQVFKYLCLTDTSARELLEPTSFNCRRRSYDLNRTNSKEDSVIMKIKNESPNCQPALASTSTDFAEVESEDGTSSQVSSCLSSTSKLSKRHRSPPSPLHSPTSKKRHSLFGDVIPRSKDKVTKRKSIELENTIEIENGEIELNQFIEECNGNPRRKEIESIKLCGVSLSDYDRLQGKKVRLPKLKDFQFDIKIPSLKHKDINNLASEISLEDYLFFTIKVGKKWQFSDIWSLGVNISFTINGITLLKVDHAKKLVVLNNFRALDKVLDSFEDETFVKSLIVSYPSFPGNINSFPAQLDRLVLLRMDKIPEFNVFIRKFRRLKELCILSPDIKLMDLSKDLVSKDRLRKVALGTANFKTTTVAPFRNLEHLFLFRCDWEMSFEDNFPSFFPNLKRVYFFGHKVSSKLLSKVLQIKSIVEIGCGWLEWDSSSSGDEIRSSIDMLTSAGLTESDKSFVLTKDVASGDGKWVARKGGLDLSQEEIFKSFQFYHLYSDYALFRS